MRFTKGRNESIFAKRVSKSRSHTQHSHSAYRDQVTDAVVGQRELGAVAHIGETADGEQGVNERLVDTFMSTPKERGLRSK